MTNQSRDREGADTLPETACPLAYARGSDYLFNPAVQFRITVMGEPDSSAARLRRKRWPSGFYQSRACEQAATQAAPLSDLHFIRHPYSRRFGWSLLYPAGRDGSDYLFNPAVQFRITVMGEPDSSAGRLRRKRWPSAVTS